jgi:hypothetical protein
MESKMNINQIKASEGYKYRLELFTFNMQRCEPEFVYSKNQANFRRKELKSAGYSVTIITI